MSDDDFDQLLKKSSFGEAPPTDPSLLEDIARYIEQFKLAPEEAAKYVRYVAGQQKAELARIVEEVLKKADVIEDSEDD